MSQQLPEKNQEPFITDLIINSTECHPDLIPLFLARKEQGIKSYGTSLQAFNGRNATQDCLEELLDAAQYAKQVTLEEPDNIIARNVYINCLFMARQLLN